MNKRKALINIISSTIFKLLVLIVSIFVRRYLLLNLGEEAVGIFSLFTSIIGVLSIAELGIGTAITFSMYKPIIEEDKDSISSLYFLYKKVYMIIFVVVSIAGLMILPIIPEIAKNNSGNFNIYISYILFLSSTVMTYLYAHKTSFINAHLDNFKTTIVRSVSVIIESTVQILCLIFIKNFSDAKIFNLFFLIILLSNFSQMIVTNIMFKNQYENKINENRIVKDDLKREVFKKTKAMFFHKIGGLLVNTTDNIIISGFIGITFLGVYTNYITIVTGMSVILALIFTSIVSVLGHSYANNSKESFHRQFSILYTINFIIGIVFFTGFYAVIDDTVLIIFSQSKESLLSKEVVFIITLNSYIFFMRNSVVVFREASGIFEKDKYRSIIEGILNLILSLILVQYLGVSGVLIATIMTSILITYIIEPRMLYKYIFEEKPNIYYKYSYSSILIFILGIILFDILPITSFENNIYNLLVRGSFSIVISFIIMITIYILDKNFRKNTNFILKSIIMFIKSLIYKIKKD